MNDNEREFIQRVLPRSHKQISHALNTIILVKFPHDVSTVSSVVNLVRLTTIAILSHRASAFACTGQWLFSRSASRVSVLDSIRPYALAVSFWRQTDVGAVWD